MDMAVTQLFAVLVPVTVKEMVQELETASVAPVSVTEVVVAAKVPGGVQVLPVAVVFAMVIPPGKVSVNPTPVSATVFADGLVIKKVSVLVDPVTTELGVNDFAMVGGATTLTQTCDEDDGADPLSVDDAPGTLLHSLPAAASVTFRVKLQEAPAVSVRALSET